MRKGLSYLAYGVAAGVVLVGASHDVLRAAASSTTDKLALFAEVFNKVRDNYAEKPDDEKMIKSAIDGMLASLDPHSNYFDPKALQDFQSSMKGEEFGGLGLEVMMEGGLVKVVSPIDDTPAARAGMMSGDLVTRIDDTAVKGLTLKEAYDVVRKAFDHFRADPGSSSLKGYILDLRNNPGGLLNQAVEITNAFVDSGDIVSTRGRTPDQGQRYSARPGVNLAQDKPLVVLINGGSASASEIVSGALQDLKRATLIGTRSFGKGSVQTILPLGENGALKLTTARYYTPSGRSIQAKGIDPDIRVLE